MELNFQEKFSIDTEGLQEITITGHVTIPMTRQAGANSRVPPDNVDAYRSRINPKITKGFQRVRKEFETSLDKRTLHFTFQDKQLPVPIAIYTTRMPLKYTVESAFMPSRAEGGIAMGAWRIAKCTLSGTIFMAAGQPRSNAYATFMSVAQDRATNGGIIPSFTGNVATANANTHNTNLTRDPGYFFWDKLRIEEDVTGLGTDLSLSWYTFCPDGLIDLIRNRGLWRPVVDPVYDAAGNATAPNLNNANPFHSLGPSAASFHGAANTNTSTFDRWAASIARTGAGNVYGDANISAAGDGDVIIDLCLPRSQRARLPPPADAGPARPVPTLGPTSPLNLSSSRVSAAAASASGSAAALTGSSRSKSGKLGLPAEKGNTPTADKSWLVWENTVAYQEERRRYARHVPMGGTSSDVTGPFNALEAASLLDPVQQIGDGDIGSVQQSKPDLLVEVRSAAPVVVMSGYSLRVGWQIPRPRILSVNGTQVIGERVIHWEEKVLANIEGDIPVWYVSWVIEGMLAEVPKGPLPSLADPIQQTPGGEEKGGRLP